MSERDLKENKRIANDIKKMAEKFFPEKNKTTIGKIPRPKLSTSSVEPIITKIEPLDEPMITKKDIVGPGMLDQDYFDTEFSLVEDNRKVINEFQTRAVDYIKNNPEFNPQDIFKQSKKINKQYAPEAQMKENDLLNSLVKILDSEKVKHNLKPIRKKENTGGLQNPEKADLDNDAKLSSYEEARGEAIEESIRESKQKGGLLSADREKFAFGTTQLAKFITSLVKKSSKNKQSDTGAFVKPLNMDRLIGASPEELKKLSSSELNAIRKEAISDIREYKTDLSPNARSEMRLEELDYLEDFLENLETEQYLRTNPRVSKEDALTEVRLRKAEQEAEDLGIEAAEIAMEKAEREKKQVGGMMMDDQMADMMEEEENEMPMDNQMADMMPEEKTKEQKAIEEAQAPDEKMEDNYVDFLIDEALSDEEEGMLMQELQANPQLSMLFDKVMEVAMEFSGSGPVEGPGSEVSDSIPARLSDGEFVFTAKAVDVIGADNLMSMMKQAEAQAEQRQPAQEGGLMEEENVMPVEQQPVEQNIRVTKETVGSQAAMQEEEDLVGDELKKSMLSTRPYVRS